MYNDTCSDVPAGTSFEVVDVPRGGVRKSLDVDDIVERYQSGQSVKAIANALGVSPPCITRRLEEAGVDQRPVTDTLQIVAARRSPERRRHLASYAFEAKRGRPNSFESLCRAALTRERRGINISPNERRLAGWLSDRGLTVQLQKAIGTYNCDLATGTVAVEVFGGNWHSDGAHAARYPDRCRYILDQGWNLVFVWDQSRDRLSVHAADYIVAFTQEADRDPSLRGQYRVIRGCGEELSRGEGELDERALVPSQRRTPSDRT